MPITVLPLVLPPVIAPISDFSVATGATGSFAVSATDPQGRALQLSLVNDVEGYALPSFISIVDNGNGTGVVTIDPVPGNAGNYTVDLIATSPADANGPAKSSVVAFVVNVTSLNEPPTIAPLGDVVAQPNTTVAFQVMAADTMQEPLTYTVTGFAGATIVPSATYAEPILSITTTSADIGDHEVTVTVTDNGHNGLTPDYSASTSFLLRVRATDTAPVLAPVGDQQAAEGTPFSLQLAASDAEGDGISYTASGPRPAQRFAELDPGLRPGRQLSADPDGIGRPAFHQRDDQSRRRPHHPAAAVRADPAADRARGG